MVDQSRLLEVLSGFAHTMTGDYELSDVLYRLTDDVTQVLDVAGAGIAFADDEGRLRYATASNDTVTALEQVQERHQQGPCAEAFRTQEPVMIADISKRAEWVDYRSVAQELGILSAAGIPLSLASERFGALNLYDSRVREWSLEEIALARVLADMAAGYLVQSRLQDTRRLAEQLQMALDNRVVIEQAKGMLSAALGISVDEAFDRLRRHSRNTNTSLRSLAASVVDDGFRLDPDPIPAAD
jgi:GAF domain-containing protein